MDTPLFTSHEVDSYRVSDDAIAYGVEEFLFCRRISLGLTALERHAPIPLPSVYEFAIKNPAHVASLALRGHHILPKDREEIFASVADAGAFTATVKARLADLESERKVCQRDVSIASVFRLSAINDEETPFLDYLRAGRNARANFFAKEYGHSNVGELLGFIGEVDAVAAAIGFVSHKTILTPDCFLDLLEEGLQGAGASEAAERVIGALKLHRAVLRRRNALEIALFAQCQVGDLGTTKLTIECGAFVVEDLDNGRLFKEELTDAYVPGETIRTEGYRVNIELILERGTR